MTHENPLDTDFDQIARYVAGEMTASERRAFEDLLGSNPQLSSAAASSQATWTAAGAKGQVDVEAGWQAVRRRIHESDLKVIPISRKARSWGGSVTILRFAAAAAVVVVAGAIWTRRGPSTREPAIVAVTAPTQQRTVDLPDGTRVILGAASEIRTVGSYGTGVREVELTGEAQFTVVHDEERPFRIRTATAFIEDLGTVFTVRAVPQEPVRVSVSEGSVRVRRSGASDEVAVVLQPRDMAVLADTGDPVVTRGIEVAPYQAWVRGGHDYRNTPAAEVFSDMERWFDVDFQVTDSTLLTRPLNVLLERTSIDEVLETLGQMLDVTLERRGRVITVAAPTRTGLRVAPNAQVGSGV
jgi:ferric-dicitrate binding protein FerR (iron transport regulator)